MRGTISTIIQTAQALSIEVLIAGLSCLGLALKISKAPHRPVDYLIFGGSLWIIYTADHLLDALRVQASLANHRHFFHKKYFAPIAVFWAVLIGIVFFLIVKFLPLRSIYAGSLLGGLSLLHLLLAQNQKFKNYPKELMVACIFNCGVWILPWSLHKHFTSAELTNVFYEGAPMALAFLMMFFSAYSNLLMLALFERKTDRLLGFSSEVLSSGLSRSLCKLYANGWLAFLFAIFYAFLSDSPNAWLVSLVFFMSGFWPWLSLRFFRALKYKQLYRFLGDLVFWLYLLPLFF